MKTIKLATLLFGIVLLSCNQAAPNSNSDSEQPQVDFQKETKNIKKMVRNLYEWYETDGMKAYDFDVTADGLEEKYIALNIQEHKRRLAQLKKTEFFSAQFLDNYNAIALEIDKNLRNGEFEYFVGEMPPYGNDASPWCNCQDVPSEDYWQSLIIEKLMIQDNEAFFIWTLGNDFQYEMKAVQEDGEWKIAYMQGFDYSKFFHE